MSRQKGGLYIGPWTLRIILGLFGLAVAVMAVSQAPDARRYMKFESM